MIQTTIFDMLYPKFKLDKSIKLITLFSGYDAQALSLKYLGVPFEHYRTCEWAVKSIQALKDLHFENDNNDYSKDFTKENIQQLLFEKGISANYNEPMTLDQIKRLNENQLRNIFNNIVATHNMVNIQQVKGEDLGVVDTDKYCYIMTYSFPCQDLSLAGKGKGMSDTSTRSGMLWEVERILDECNELGNLPQILLMENVPQVHGEGNTEDFNKWQLKLETLGYKNYWEDLIATDYGIPQTRNRCFMVSILGDYSYSFPPKQPLKLRLKDMLEDNVDEKYYLSDAMIKYLTSEDTKGYQRKQAFESVQKNIVENGIAGTITTNAGSRATDNFIVNKVLKETLEQNEIKDGVNYVDAYNRTIDNTGLSKTISTRVDASNNTYLAIKNATKKGYLEAEEGDGVNICGRMEYQRGNVQKGKSLTLNTMGGENAGVVVGTYQYAKSDKFMNGKDRLQIGKEVSDTLQTSPKEGVAINMKTQLCNNLIKNGKVKEYDVIRHSYTTARNEEWDKRNVEQNNISPTLDTRCDCLGVVTIGNYSPSNHNASRIVDQNYLAPTVMENHGTLTAIAEQPKVLGGIGEKKSNNNTQWYQQDRIYDNNVAISVTTAFNPYYKNDLRIRKLTPKECFRLMGVKDEDYEKVAKNQSNASLYHLAGDSIVVNVLMAIFKEMIQCYQ